MLSSTSSLPLMHDKKKITFFLLRICKTKFIPLCQSKCKVFFLSHIYIHQLFNFTFISELPVCLFIFLNHILTSANASRHNSERQAKLHLIQPALMSFISAEGESAGKQKRSVEVELCGVALLRLAVRPGPVTTSFSDPN